MAEVAQLVRREGARHALVSPAARCLSRSQITPSIRPPEATVGLHARAGSYFGRPVKRRRIRRLPVTTAGCAEKVRSQFLSLRQIALGRVFSGRTRWQFSPVTVAISRLSFGLPIGGAGLLFSERPASLRSSGLHRFGTVLENRNVSSHL